MDITSLYRDAISCIAALALATAPGCSPAEPPFVNPSAPKYLIVNADDLGLDPSVDEGIIAAFKDGVLTSTSAMVNIPGAAGIIKHVRNEYPVLSVGLHLNITTGRPVLDPSEIPTLVDEDGYFYNERNIPWQLSKISFEEVLKELRAQAENFLATGSRPSHLDYHHHMVALYTPFFEAVRILAKELDIPVRNPVPASVYKLVELPDGGGSSAAMRQMIRMGTRRPIRAMKMMKVMNPDSFIENHQSLKDIGIVTPDWFIDAFYGNASVANFISILEQLPPGVSEIMVHPGTGRTGFHDDYEGRAGELEVLVSPEVQQKIRELGITPICYRRLAGMKGNQNYGMDYMHSWQDEIQAGFIK